MGDDSLRLRFDTFDLDEANARLTRDGQPIQLPPRAFAVLCELARKRGQLVTKNALLDEIWGHQHVSESVLKTVISEVRAALTDDARRPRYIETASRFGYRFIANAVVATPASEPIGADGATTAAPQAPPSPSIVGRSAALAKLREAYRRALTGERQLLWIAGEAGVGKTTLIESFVSELDPMIPVYGRCVEHFGTGEPYLPLLEAIRELCRRDPELPQMMRAVAPTWLIQMPWFIGDADRSALQRELAGTHPDRMVREMRELMDRYTAKRPMVFVLEDLHWSDVGTLRMMEHFARRPRVVRLLWIGSFRLTQVIAEDHPLRELRQELRSSRLCDEILLDPFSESEVGAYLERRLPKVRFPEGFVRRLHSHTDGLPLFVANVTDSLVAQAAANPAVAQEWLHASAATPLPLPDSLAGVIEAQISRLPPEVQTVLTAASVCGAEFRAGTVADLLERDALEVAAICDDLVRRQVWLRHVEVLELPDGGFDSRYAFQHALYEHVFYQRNAVSQRVQFHRRAARSLDRNRTTGEAPTPAEMASHYERGHETLAALRAYAEAAGLALSHFAHKDAANVTAHALTLLKRCPESQERVEVELALMRHTGVAASLLYGVASPQARVAFERALALCDLLPQTPERAIALNGLGWVYFTRGEYEEALQLAARMHDIATTHENVALQVYSRNLTGVTRALQGRLVEACESLAEGLGRVQQLDERLLRSTFVVDPEVSMRINIAVPLMDRGLADQSRAHVRIAQERADRIGQPMARMLAHWGGGLLGTRLEDPESVARHAAELDSILATDMITQAKGPSLWLRGWAEGYLSDPHTGHEHILQGYQSHVQIGMYAGCTEVLSYDVDALIRGEEWALARKQLEDALQLALRIEERCVLPTLLLQQARISLLADKDVAAARASMLNALLEAENQPALGLKLKALVALAELEDRTAEDLFALREGYKQITEGFDTPVCKRARQLLET